MVPKLRFSEFSKGWQQKKIGDVFTIFSGFAFKSTDATTSGCRWLKIADVGCQIMTPSTPSFLPNHFSNEYHKFIIRKDDYVIALTRPILNGKLKIAIAGKEYDGSLLNQRVGKIVTKNNPKFVYSLLQMESTVSKINNCIAGTDPPNLSTQDIKDMIVFVPIIEEQIKIADFISSVDEKITLLNKQYDLLCQYKKGMMQEIFSQKMRFKDDSGRAFPEWKSTILDEVVDIITNGLALNQNDSKNGYPVSRIETISECCINMKKVGFVDTDNDISNYKLNYGDMLFSNINSISHIGKIAYFDIDDTLYHGMNLLRIVIKNSHCKLFFYYQLTTDTNKKYFESRANQAVSQASINQTELRKTPVQVPCKEEQTKIANFLSALDDKIVVKKAELDKLKTWKQGLLQQMFI
ncbi:restriction endonuclease subunit S [Leclercia adecarboxylata]|uniref:restriction endonuclease subunit S n=1 Tax=Leclercia adecarboxylata TaxID=83655 RepID=UPI001E3EA8B9|nr:restriction endonuclease subunit S [Leclercia adecarboxylata]